MIATIIILITIVVFVLRVFSFKKYDLDKIPGPHCYPIIGNFFDILTDRVTIFNRARVWGRQYNGLHKLKIFHNLYSIEVSNPQDIETIISTPTHNTKSFIYNFLQPWLQNGLLLSTGAKWHERRKILTPTFHFNILRHFTTVLEENSQALVKMLEKETVNSKTNIIPIISGYTLNSICETAMGVKIDDDSTGLGEQYKDAIHQMGTFCVERLTKPWLHFDWMYKLTLNDYKQKKVLKIIRAFPNKVINERRTYIEQSGDEVYLEGANDQNEVFMKNKRRMAMLDLLLSAESENKIDRSGIQEEVDTFMFEGHDTTAVALNFALMELANHKDIQDKVVEEIRSIFGKSNRDATMEDLNQMKYLECCIKESLRLYPSVHLIGREFQEKIVLSNYEIPAGIGCTIHIFDLHRHPDLYPDPLVYDPDRFLPQHSEGRHPYAYIPFSAGPRNCIGQKFAMLEMKSAVSAILRKLELHPVTRRDDIEFSGDIVLRTTHPIYVKFEKRK